MKDKILYAVGGLLIIGVFGFSINVAGNLNSLNEKVNFLAAGSGEQRLGGTTNFDSLELGGDLTVTGAQTITGNQTVGGTLGVTGATTLVGLFTAADVNLTGDMGLNTTSPVTDFDTEGVIRVYPDGTATSTCGTAQEGALMYATGTADFYFCNGTAWTAI